MLLQVFAPVIEISANEISPFIGDINFDISIRETTDTVSAGNTATFLLEVKSTGSVIEYNDVKVDIDLPDQSVATFNQDLNDLVINGVVPVYDQSNNRLTYNFDTLPTGNKYQVMIMLNT